MRFNTCSFVILVTMMVAVAVGQSAPSIIQNNGSPVQIVSLLSTASDFLASVKVKNLSTREVRSFELGAITAASAVCGPTEAYGSEKVMFADRVVIGPGQTVVTSDYKLLPSEVQSFANANGSKAVHTQLTVLRVRFSDGGVWSSGPRRRIYDKKLMEDEALLQCSTSPAVTRLRAAVAEACHSHVRATAMFQGGSTSFTCAPSTNSIICSNAADGLSCTTSFCSDGCPKQTCAIAGGGGATPAQPPAGDTLLVQPFNLNPVLTKTSLSIDVRLK